MASAEQSQSPNSAQQTKYGSRVPPQAPDMEASVLGSVLLEKDALLKVIDMLSPDDFYQRAHGIIYQAMLDLFNRKDPIDLLTLNQELQTKGQLETVGGEEYLASLAEMVPSAVHIAHYGKVVQQKATLRNLIAAGSDVIDLGFDESTETEELLDGGEKRIFEVSKRMVKQDYVSLSNALESAFDRMDRIHKEGGGLRGVSTGFHVLDDALGGLQPSNLVVLAARPSMGKTSLALDFARNAAESSQKGVVFFSLEMSQEEIVDRILCSQARVDLWKMRTGKLGKEDFTNIAHAMDNLSQLDLFIDDTPGNGAMQMRAMMRRMLSETEDLGLVIVDYLQLMESTVNTDNVVQQIGEISRSLKALAREFNVPVVALSQLNRSVENRSPQIPKLADLRESGSIEQDADVVLFIYREERENPDTERKGIAEVHIAKQRNGPIGKVDIGFKDDFAAFFNLDKTHGG
jgi:replicative DNA helicase